ncbi:RidA family protein [Devosia rhodophyticola]|uniref:RidA family protein n=1 Tax=Devosia rhodophyticola TaxID=3026423 RepID=A0ABY7YY91_9HYPH|nr:RidA family protein [Devosia rhodophyticola]WDR06197.1 RidA family protein [Devosia rhodophyticola]
MLKIINEGAKSDLPFSPAIVAGEFMYVSGQASVDAETGGIIVGSFEEEMRRSITNLEAILKAGGLSLDHVINVKSYVANQDDLAQYNAIYAEYFAKPLPTRSTIIGVLGTKLKFELDCVAYVPGTRGAS